MKIFQCAAIAATLLGTLAFGWTDTAAAAQMAQASMALHALTIIFLPVYVAEDEDMWRNLGLDVTLHQITGLGSTNAMLAGSVDFAVQSGESLIRGNIRSRHMLGITLMADKEAFEFGAPLPRLTQNPLRHPRPSQFDSLGTFRASCTNMAKAPARWLGLAFQLKRSAKWPRQPRGTALI
jgi:NMT1/THI5 like